MKPTEPAAAIDWRWSALVATAALLLCALMALVLLQVQQLQHLNRSLHSGQEARATYMDRQLAEYLQLREQWALALNVSQPLDLPTLALRYDIWVGRVSVLHEDSAVRRLALAIYPELDSHLAEFDAFVRAADAVVQRPLPEPTRRQALAQLHPQLLALAVPMQALPLAASHAGTHEQQQRDLTLTHYSRVALAVTALLTLMTLTFAALVLRQMRLLRQRQTALVRLTQELAHARHAAEQSSQAKSHFLANMSHEIRTPFQGLLGMLGMLRNTPLDARQVDYLRTATESADHLLAVLNDILDLSQLEAGRLHINAAPTVLRKLLQEVEALMRPQASQLHLALHVDVDPAVPERVLLDATRVKQVLFNLLSNALKFSTQGSIELSLGLQPGSADGLAGAGHAGQADRPARGPEPLGNAPGAPADERRLIFAVSDSGPGMDSQTLQRVFDRFERGHGAATRTEGSGLGLAIARNLAQLMGGELLATSTLGKGSRFSIVLPLVPVPPSTAGSTSSAISSSSASSSSSAGRDEREPPAASAQPLRILVAEDHPVNRQVVAALLESLGQQAHFVADGAQAVAAVQTQAFDLVLMDLHMPNIDGIEATRRIRALPDRCAATVPIVALTADAFTDTRERCLVAGMNSFLTKPISRDKLGALLRQLFGPGSAEPGIDADSAADAPHASELVSSHGAPLIDAQAVARTQQLLSAPRYAEVLGQYLDQATATAAQMHTAVREAQPLMLRTQAHATGGAALNLGLPALAATARALQEGAAHLPAHEVARLVQRFDDLIAATRDAATSAALLPGSSTLHR